MLSSQNQTAPISTQRSINSYQFIASVYEKRKYSTENKSLFTDNSPVKIYPHTMDSPLQIFRELLPFGQNSAEQKSAAAVRGLLDTVAGLSPQERRAALSRNRSYIFFREAPVPDPALGPVAAAGVPLTPGRSLAVDRALITFHAPVYVEADLSGGPFRRLLVAQDTGSAILGPARGDIFFGSGETAFAAAARVRDPARLALLKPREG